MRDEAEPVRLSGEFGLRGLAANRRIDFGQFLQAMSDPNPSVRRTATAYLPYVSHPRDVFPVLMRAIADPDPRVREAACDRIRVVNDVDLEEILPALRRAMQDPDVSVCFMARSSVQAIERADDQFRSSTLPHCLADLKEVDPGFRHRAAMILAQYGPRARAAVPALIVCLDDRDPGVQAEAARTLGLIGPAARPALPALNRLATDEDPVIQLAAKAAATALRETAKP